MRCLAETFFRYGADEGSFQVILAPDVVLMLFVDGSSILITSQSMMLYESCWEEPMPTKREASFVDFYEIC